MRASPVNLSDDEILRRVQRGKPGEYIHLFDRYYPRVESFARWQTHNPELAADVASETFLRAYRSVGAYRTGQNHAYLAYLLQICRRIIYKEHARAAANSSVSIEDVGEEAAVPPESWDLPLASLIAEERRKIVHGALDLLPADDREIILLAFEQDLSRRDIAEVMGKPSITAVTSHLHRAMQKLRSAIARQGYFEPVQSARETKG